MAAAQAAQKKEKNQTEDVREGLQKTVRKEGSRT